MVKYLNISNFYCFQDEIVPIIENYTYIREDMHGVLVFEHFITIIVTFYLAFRHGRGLVLRHSVPLAPSNFWYIAR